MSVLRIIFFAEQKVLDIYATSGDYTPVWFAIARLSHQSGYMRKQVTVPLLGRKATVLSLSARPTEKS
jgi:hypothetical protein